mmetsp:Transcript_26543/g.82992  ORF Transcript_26543/g.82992 Transcript_26543/m.82992 type:complete len:259 (-) Transcript_26543:734-1510(-)
MGIELLARRVHLGLDRLEIEVSRVPQVVRQQRSLYGRCGYGGPDRRPEVEAAELIDRGHDGRAQEGHGRLGLELFDGPPKGLAILLRHEAEGRRRGRGLSQVVLRFPREAEVVHSLFLSGLQRRYFGFDAVGVAGLLGQRQREDRRYRRRGEDAEDRGERGGLVLEQARRRLRVRDGDGGDQTQALVQAALPEHGNAHAANGVGHRVPDPPPRVRAAPLPNGGQRVRAERGVHHGTLEVARAHVQAAKLLEARRVQEP